MKIGIATGGGDCPGLNTVIRAVAKASAESGGSPTTFVRAQCSMFGAIPIKDAVGKLKTVPPDGGLIRTARALGICMGD